MDQFWAELPLTLWTFLNYTSINNETSFRIFRDPINKVHDIWTSNGNILQVKWENFLLSTGATDCHLFVGAIIFSTVIFFWTFGGLLTYIGLKNWPLTRKYKYQPGTHEPGDWKCVQDIIIPLLRNQIIVNIPTSALCYYGMSLRGFSPIQQLPSVPRIIMEIMFCAAIEEIIFYCVHRVLHLRWFYKHIHKVHHEWKAPVALAGLYCHPVEHFFCNLLPPYVGMLILGSHVVTIWLWATLTVFSAINAHCGHNYPIFPLAEHHDFHHQKFNCCYGVLGYMDRLFGTDQQYQEFVKKREAATKSTKLE